MMGTKAGSQLEKIKMMRDVTEARVDRQIRDEAARDGFKVTEPQVAKLLTASKRLIQLRRALNEAKQIEANAKIAVEGFRQRRDMLIQHGATEREDRKGELRT